tara:strand:- start:754 stop:1059 length:306 start_codon:yes stop_codon:yes gene_type:complete
MPINLKIIPTPEKSKKRFRAIFRIHKGGDIIKIQDFGLKGASTYLDNKDKIKRKNYRARHKGDLKTKDFKRAGFLSMDLLWGKHTDLNKNLKDYKIKYKLS